jgi:putative thiamine transport system permease protein
VNWVERCFVLILILPILGLLDDALGRYSSASWAQGWDRLSTEPVLVHSLGLSLWVATVSLIVSLFIARALSAQALRLTDFQLWRSLLLAMPHSALAIGLVLALSAGRK